MKNSNKNIHMHCPLMNGLLQWTISPDSPADSHENRTRIGMLAGWVGTLLSLLLCLAKGWLGILSGSVSLLADATNNLTDAGSGLVIALGFKWSRKPSDADHPFGHGRIEAVVTLVLAIALILVGIEVAKSGLMRLIHPVPLEDAGWVMIAIGVTILVKLWMAIFAKKLAKLSGSHVLEADAWNHTFDVASTLLVLLAFVGSRLGWVALDGWTAIAVALFILFTGIKYAREAIDILLGKLPDAAEVAAIQKIVEAIPGVLGVHEIMIHQYGDVRMVSFHIEVEQDLSAVEAHQISEAAETAVESKLEWRTVVHADPIDRSHPLFEPLYLALKKHVKQAEDLVDFHDVRLEGKTPPYQASFDLVARTGTCRKRYQNIYASCAKMLDQHFAKELSCVEIGVEALVDSAPMDRKTLCNPPFSESFNED
jgi:cation diffusion facilitator family transporter